MKCVSHCTSKYFLCMVIEDRKLREPKLRFWRFSLISQRWILLLYNVMLFHSLLLMITGHRCLSWWKWEFQSLVFLLKRRKTLFWNKSVFKKKDTDFIYSPEEHIALSVSRLYLIEPCLRVYYLYDQRGPQCHRTPPVL